MPPARRRAVIALFAAAALGLPAGAAAQTSVIPQDGAELSPTPPVPLSDGGDGERAGGPKAESTGSELPNTGSDPRTLLLVGLATSLFGVGLRLRTADADDY